MVRTAVSPRDIDSSDCKRVYPDLPRHGTAMDRLTYLRAVDRMAYERMDGPSHAPPRIRS